MAADVVTAAEPPIGGFRYLFKSTGGSSDKYGPCEVCGERVSEVFHQAEEKRCAAKHADDGQGGYEARLKAKRIFYISNLRVPKIVYDVVVP